jgi:aminopeptidase N
MLGELRKRYEYKSVSTDEFRALAASFLPAGSQDPRLEMFFDAWVYGTGIPSVKLSHSVQGKSGALKLSGSVGLSGVEDDFSITVPIEVQTAPGKSVTHWVRAGAEATPFNIPLKQRPGKVTLAPGYSILAR